MLELDFFFLHPHFSSAPPTIFKMIISPLFKMTSGLIIVQIFRIHSPVDQDFQNFKTIFRIKFSE